MAVESDADRLALLSDFGQAVTINGTSVTAIFDDKFLMIDEMTMNIESSEPQIECRTSDVSGFSNGAMVVIGTTTYYITTLEPDGTGLTTITLHL